MYVYIQSCDMVDATLHVQCAPHTPCMKGDLWGWEREGNETWSKEVKHSPCKGKRCLAIQCVCRVRNFMSQLFSTTISTTRQQCIPQFAAMTTYGTPSGFWASSHHSPLAGAITPSQCVPCRCHGLCLFDRCPHNRASEADKLAGRVHIQSRSNGMCIAHYGCTALPNNTANKGRWRERENGRIAQYTCSTCHFSTKRKQKNVT